MVGWRAYSWGYHSDDGFCYKAASNGFEYGPKFGQGDVIGCGIDPFLYELDPMCRAVFWTKNGKPLGSLIIGEQEALFPVVTGFGKVKFKANFGKREFVWKKTRYEREEALELEAGAE